MIGFCPLASGSKGNCTYIGTQSTKILIDVGLSAKATKEKLLHLNVHLEEIEAILITHEHSDHTKGLQRIALKHNIPIFCNSDTAKALYDLFKENPRFKIFSTGESFIFGDMQITPFSIQHDAMDPVAFTIETQGIRIGFCADLGVATTHVAKNLLHCDHLYLESNHEPSMVHSCNRPPVYKERVLGRQGHLSNQQCAALLKQIAHSGLQSIHLAHLSGECNSEELALRTIQETLKELNITADTHIAYQEKVSNPIYFKDTIAQKKPIALSVE